VLGMKCTVSILELYGMSSSDVSGTSWDHRANISILVW